MKLISMKLKIEYSLANMDLPNQNEPREIHKFVEETRIFKHSCGEPKIVVSDSKSIINLIFQQSVSALSETNIDPGNFFPILFNLNNCIKAEPGLIHSIETPLIMKIYDYMKEWDLLSKSSQSMSSNQILQYSQLISAGFTFFYTYLHNHPNPDLSLLFENQFPRFALSKIPIDSPCNCLMELLKFSDKLSENDPFNLYPFMLENDLKSKLLALYREFHHLEHQQVQILKILRYLLKKVDFTQDELSNLFFETTQVFLSNVATGKDDELISFFEFLLFINSDSFYSSLPLCEEFSDFFFAFLNARLMNFDSKEELIFRLFDVLRQFSERCQENIEILINHRLISALVSFFRHSNISEELKLSTARFVDFIMNSNSKFGESFLCPDYFELMKEFLNEHGFFDQSIAFRYISYLLQNFHNETARDCLIRFDPVAKIVVFLGSDYYEVISMLLIGIVNIWKNYQNGKAYELEIFSELTDLINDANFYETIIEIDSSDYKCNELVQQLIQIRNEIAS